MAWVVVKLTDEAYTDRDPQAVPLCCIIHPKTIEITVGVAVWVKIGKAKVQNRVFMGTIDESERGSPFERLPPLQHLPPMYHTHSPPPHSFSPLPPPPSACTFSAPPAPPHTYPPGLSCHQHHYQPPPSMENPIPKPPEHVIIMVLGQDVVSLEDHVQTLYR